MAIGESNRDVVLITGASSGIGKCVAGHLVKRGYIVYGTSRRPQQELPGMNWLQLDVSRPDQIKSALQVLIAKEGRIDVLINNAGLGMISSCEEAPPENVTRVMETNFGGVLGMTQAVLPKMRAQRSGKIINVSSIAGLMGLPFRSIYSASKFAVEGLTESLRLEVAQFGIQVCSLQPGSIRTEIKASRVSHLPEASPYQPNLNSTSALVDSEVAQGIDALAVAETIENLLKQDFLRSKYIVAKPFQKFSTALRKVLPSTVFEKMLKKHYGLS